MFVRVHVSMYVCTYVYIYACRYIFIHTCIYAFIHVCICLSRRGMYVMYTCMCLCICGCKHFSMTNTYEPLSFFLSQYYVTHGALSPCNKTIAQIHTLQHTATHCNTLHRATYCNTLHRATYTVQHTARHCTVQHTATHCYTLEHMGPFLSHPIKSQKCTHPHSTPV